MTIFIDHNVRDRQTDRKNENLWEMKILLCRTHAETN